MRRMKRFGELVAVPLDVELQRAAAHVLHHHVAGLVGAEEILHAHHVRVRDHRERAALLEEALQAVAEDGQVGLVGELHLDRLRCAAAATRAGIP